MTQKQLLTKLRRIIDRQEENNSDKENDHLEADELLLEFIDDPEVTTAFKLINKWYA